MKTLVCLTLALAGACPALVAGCRPLTPAEHTRNLRGGLEVGIASCRLYALSPQIPRDAKLEAYCPGIITTKESP